MSESVDQVRNIDERASKKPRRLGVKIAAGATALAMTATFASKAEKSNSADSRFKAATYLKDCFKGKLPAVKPAGNNKKSLILRPKKDNFPNFPTRLSPKIENKVANSTVLIDLYQGEKVRHQTGVLVKNGNHVDVLTTASGVEIASPSGVIIYDRKTHHTTPLFDKGCLVREGNIDLAVLEISPRVFKNLGWTALKLADKPLTRGEAAGFVNYQHGFSPPKPTNFVGLVAKNDGLSTRALTGLTYERKANINSLDSYTARSGSGGGPVVNVKTGELAGITMVGTLDHTWLDRQGLRKQLDMDIKGVELGTGTGVVPHLEFDATTALIKAALKAAN